jgi:hypothetical protein
VNIVISAIFAWDFEVGRFGPGFQPIVFNKTPQSYTEFLKPAAKRKNIARRSYLLHMYLHQNNSGFLFAMFGVSVEDKW